MVSVQLFTFYLLRNVSSLWAYFFAAYFFGGVMNHALTLAVHEISHNQAFGAAKPLYNRMFGIFANLPLGFPMSITFKKYHIEHHRYQGDNILDTDIPSLFEARIFTTTFRKFIWVILQPFFYGFRPLFTYPKKPTSLEYINTTIQLLFDLLIGLTLGWNIVWYMVLSTLIAMGLHPVAGHFISEHYVMFDADKEKLMEKAKKSKQSSNGTNNGDLAKCDFEDDVYIAQNGLSLVPETCSYYGPLNWLTFNVGYHVEHHDFPSIPATMLPKVRQIAPEYYDSLHYHTSWVNVIYRYIFDPNIGPYSRVKRPHNSSFKSED